MEDSHLFTVLVTRARSRLEVGLSADPPPGGLVADWLAQADAPPGSPPSRTDIDPWTAGIAADLADAGLTPVTGYPVGVHTVDIAIGAGGRRGEAVIGLLAALSATPAGSTHAELRSGAGGTP